MFYLHTYFIFFLNTCALVIFNKIFNFHLATSLFFSDDVFTGARTGQPVIHIREHQ